MSVSLDILSQPVGYQRFESYHELRNKIKDVAQVEHYRQHVVVFGLTWIAGDEEGFNFLVACTSTGDLVVWKVPIGEKGCETTGCKAIFRYVHALQVFLLSKEGCYCSGERH